MLPGKPDKGKISTAACLGDKTFYLAMVWAGLGETDRAFALLDEAHRERFPFLWQVRVQPEFDPLRDDPRYAELRRRLRL